LTNIQYVVYLYLINTSYKYFIPKEVKIMACAKKPAKKVVKKAVKKVVAKKKK